MSDWDKIKKLPVYPEAVRAVESIVEKATKPLKADILTLRAEIAALQAELETLRAARQKS